jgi:flavin reductase (DIM6/NTAB) family NADH-FMN oxidoreductase RutF
MLMETGVADKAPSAPIALRQTDTKPLRNAFGRFATGVTIVTVQTPDGPLGITANSFSSVSLDPPLVMWSIAKHSSRFAPFAEAEHFAIHVLAREQDHLCWRFAKSGRDFSGVELAFNPEGAPLLPGALARFECEIANRIHAGDHLMLLARVRRMSARDGEPMMFFGGRYRGLAPEG